MSLTNKGNEESESEVAQLCPTLCDPLEYSPPGSSVHGILQARILERVAISFSRGSSRPRDQTQVSHTAGRCFTIWATREALFYNIPCLIFSPLLLSLLINSRSTIRLRAKGFHTQMHHFPSGIPLWQNWRLEGWWANTPSSCISPCGPLLP